MSDPPPAPRPRARDLGLVLGRLEPGPLNAITDVGDVRVGHVTLFRGQGPLREGVGPVRTGVTVVLPHGGNLFRDKVTAAFHVINAFGKMAGTTQMEELGTIETPIALTSTLCVGRVFDGLVDHGLRQSPEMGILTGSVNPVVAECNDSYLNDLRGRHVHAEHVLAAIEGATGGPVPEGAVGAGTGMLAYGGWKGGIGTASRRLEPEDGDFTVGALALVNFGGARELTIAGFPVGRHIVPSDYEPALGGSCIVVVATDAPADTRQLGRMARRVQSGLARTGTVTYHGSGEYAVAFSTAGPVPHGSDELVRTVQVLNDDHHPMAGLFEATVEATEEAVINAMFVADTVRGRDDNVAPGLPVDRVLALIRGNR